MRRRVAFFLLLITSASLAGFSAAGVSLQANAGESSWRGAQQEAKNEAVRKLDVIYVPTPPEVVDEMLRLAEIKKGDVLYDLG